MLTEYNGQAITYDEIGNPLTYRDGITMTWQNGRELATFSNDNYDITYTYDASGMRTAKDIDGLGEICYTYENGQLLQMDYLGYLFTFNYDANGTPVGFRLDDTYYYYGLNSRGDVITLYDSSGSKVATYTYDAYGKPLSTTYHSSAHTFAIDRNPLRYRGYVYDRETGFYYLHSRYYDPTTCRFINEDIYYDTGRGFTGLNMFAYCSNNPIMGYDPTGTREPVGGGPISAETAEERRLSCERQREISLIATDNNSFIGGATMVSNNYLYISFDTLFWGEENGINSTKLTSGDFNQPITFFAQEANDWWRISDYHVGVNAIINDYSSSLSISLFGIHCRGAYDGGEAYEIQIGVDKIGYTISSDYDFNNNTMGAYNHKYIRPWSIVTVFVLAGVTYGAASGLFATQQLQSCY